MLLFEGSLEVKLPTIWTNGKAEVGRVREIEGARRKKMQVRKKVGKPPNTLFFQWLVAPQGRKVGSLTPGADFLRFWCCQLRKLRKPRRIVSFLMLSTSKIGEVSKNCFVFDVVNFKNSQGLAELFRFWSSSKIEKVSQNCFALDFVKFKNWGFAELFCFWCCQVPKLRKFRRIVLVPCPSKIRIFLK